MTSRNRPNDAVKAPYGQFYTRASYVHNDSMGTVRADRSADDGYIQRAHRDRYVEVLNYGSLV
jgi:hypothetical protein